MQTTTRNLSKLPLCDETPVTAISIVKGVLLQVVHRTQRGDRRGGGGGERLMGLVHRMTVERTSRGKEQLFWGSKGGDKGSLGEREGVCVGQGGLQ